METVLLVVYLSVLSFFDSRECKVPLALINGGILAALVWLFWRCMCNSTEWKWLAMSAILGVLPGVFMVGVSYITGKVGLGDGLVLMVTGVVIGYRKCLALICFSLLLMSVWCIGVLCCQKGNRYTRIPYIPFLTVVYLMSLLM